MPFFQAPPALGNAFADDTMLRAYVARMFPSDARAAVTASLDEIGALAAGPLAELLAAEPKAEPVLTHWDAWGHRFDRIELTPLWKLGAKIAAEQGLVATAYERRHGALSRVHQFALVYLFEPSSGVFTCPLAMTDGAAKTLLASGNRALVDRAVPRLTSRDHAQMWTSGQWMTERTGGSDVGISETIARRDEAGADAYRLYGTKWFTSATTSEMALTLARPEGNPPGGSGLALFYVETRDARGGMLNGIQINRLKDKLGTRMVPTAELTLDGARAVLVTGERDGVKSITPMLSVTRTWNAVCAAGGMRRAVMLAKDYAKKRVAFGAPLAEKPLHVDTLAALEAEARAAFLLAFRAVDLLGREEAGVLTDREAQLLRLATPLAKLTTGKQAVAVASEALEAFGGAGYVEDTGLPRLLRDAQVLPIWEGTTNVLSLEVLRALRATERARSPDAPDALDALEALEDEVRTRTAAADASLAAAARTAREAIAHAKAWLARARARARTDGAGPAAMEADARRFALTLGRAWELALLVDHAVRCGPDAGAGADPGAAAAARRFARREGGIDALHDAAADPMEPMDSDVAPSAKTDAEDARVLLR